MYKQLQRRFIWGSALVLLLVIALVTGAVYGITSMTIKQQTGVILEMLLENNGDIPEKYEFDKSQKRFLALSGESVYESRFFTALKSDSGITISETRVAMLSKEEMDGAVSRAFESKKDVGTIHINGMSVFRFAKEVKDDGSVMAVLLDCTSRYSMQSLTMSYMAGLWLLVLVLYIFFIKRYSKKLIKPFVENDEKQKRFITNASHELKTPLAVIAANTEMTEAMGGKSKWTESTRRQIVRLQTLIEDLVVLTRADEIKESDFESVDVSAVVAETAESFRNLAESEGKRFLTEIEPGVQLKTDKRSLQHVNSVLMDNAVKYCDENGTIQISLEKRAKGARLTVANTYAQGKNENVSRFFERFYRQDESHNSQKSGFGIGLSMVKEIVEKLKGKIKARYQDDMIYFTVDF